MTETPDPFRALDGHEPASDWDDVVSRAARPGDVLVAGDLARNRSRRPLLVAAAVLVLLAVAGAVAVAGGDHPRNQRVASGRGGDASDIWGHEWIVTRIVDGGGSSPVIPGRDAALTLDARREGLLLFNGCNGAGGAVHLDGAVVVADGDWFSTAMGCVDANGQPDPLMAQDNALNTFLRGRPKIAIDGQHLTLTEGQRTIHLTDATAFDPPARIWDTTWEIRHLAADGTTVRADQVQLLFSTRSDAGHEVLIASCGAAVARAELDAQGFLRSQRFEAPIGHPTSSCAAADATVAIEHLVGAGPVVLLQGDTLTLRAESSELEAVRVPADPGGDPVATTTQPDPTTSTLPSTSPTDPGTTTTTTVAGGGSVALGDDQFFGHLWTVTRVLDHGVEKAFPGAMVDARTAGQVTVAGCNGAGGAMVEAEHRLAHVGGWSHTVKGCVPSPGQPDLQARDDWFDPFLWSGPAVVVHGNVAILTVGGPPTNGAAYPDYQVDLQLR